MHEEGTYRRRVSFKRTTKISMKTTVLEVIMTSKYKRYTYIN